MSVSRFDKDNKFRRDAGEEDMQVSTQAEVSVDSSVVADYEQGDTVDLTIKGRLGEVDPETGKANIEVLSVKCEEMPMEAKQYRRDNKPMTPPMSSGDEE